MQKAFLQLHMNQFQILEWNSTKEGHPTSPVQIFITELDRIFRVSKIRQETLELTAICQLCGGIERLVDKRNQCLLQVLRCGRHGVLCDGE